VIGLSGSGKSNLLGFIAQRVNQPGLDFLLIDCNRMNTPSSTAFFGLLRRAISEEKDGVNLAVTEDLAELEELLAARLSSNRNLCLLLDRFDVLTGLPFFPGLAGNLRALRDMHKFFLSYVIATRRPLDQRTELAELFFGRTMWLGPLQKSDAFWSARRDLQRMLEQEVDETVLEKIVELSSGYPSLLRASCEAYVDGASLTFEGLASHPAVQRRVKELWVDEPQRDELIQARLQDQPLLHWKRNMLVGKIEAEMPLFDMNILTAKEHLLLETLMAHAGQVCEKDDLIQDVWPEDVIFEQGVRDESLAQLVRRLRVKIEANPGDPRYIHTVPGRGYLFKSE
jgi:hypothetical protein